MNLFNKIINLFRDKSSKDEEKENLNSKVNDLEEKLKKLTQNIEKNNELIVNKNKTEDILKTKIKELEKKVAVNHLVVYEDKEQKKLKFEIAALEEELENLSEEKNEYINELNNFNTDYMINLGDVIQELLGLKKELLELQLSANHDEDEGIHEEYEDIKKEYEGFYNEYKNTIEIEENKGVISNDELIELKKVFRKSVKMCHPDIVEEKYKKEAHNIMIKLNDAYQRKMLHEVIEIFESLQNNFKTNDSLISDTKYMKQKIIYLKKAINDTKVDIHEIIESEEYIFLGEIDNLDNFFEDTKIEFEEEIKRVKQQLIELKTYKIDNDNNSNLTAQIFPTLENIKRLKVAPTEGEWFLINYLLKNLSNEVEIYFQPFLNGDRPDIILMQKGVGVAIIEVKDWNLDSYKIDTNNQWHLKKNNQHIKSPFKQVFDYKSNMFSLHIDGLLERKLQNKNFYGRIQPYVYFHKASKKSLDAFYIPILEKYKTLNRESNNDFKNKKLSWDKYEKRGKYLKQKKSKIERDLRYCAVGNDNLEKITLPPKVENLFTDKIYEEFIRYLQPPYHSLNDGTEITYTKEQKKHIASQNKHQKIIGVAGSGKTVVLAKKAVNAHKRHGDTVLILTYNLTLTRYIHDKISDVRENFSWGKFYITNYHQLITQLLNNLGVDVLIPDEIQKNIDSIEKYNDKEKYIEEYFEKTYFSNIKLFEEYKEQISKYKTILIDEIQDYKSEWIDIIKTYFLKENSEFVLFGDEKQNIYERKLGKDKRPNTKITGAWNKLKESIRHKNWDGSQILPLIKKFQKEFLKEKYNIDKYKEEEETKKIIQETLVEDKTQILFKLSHYKKNKLDDVAHTIINKMREHKAHNDDVVILASKIAILQEIDSVIRKESNINTITIFEAKEDKEKYKNDIKSIRKFKKIAFNHHSGKLKISTIHSFKGYEAKTVFLIVDEKNKYKELDDNAEMVYTGITRSKFNIMVFTLENSEYNDFFSKYLEN